MRHKTKQYQSIKIRSGKKIYSALVTALLFGGLGIYLLFGAHAQSTANPALAQACGLDMAFVIDNSLSINSSESTKMKSALTYFVNVMKSTSTQFAVIKFANNATLVQPFTTNITSVKNAINARYTGGSTNLAAGLTKARAAYDPRPNRSNLVVVATDGAPNDLQAAIDQADYLKGIGTRILGLYIDDGTPNYGGGGANGVSNLKQIIGPNQDTGSVLTSDVITTSFDQLASSLASFAIETCSNDGTGEGIGGNGNDKGLGKGKGNSPAPGTGKSSSTSKSTSKSKSSSSSAATKQSNKPKPVAAGSARGDSTKKTEINPSPFYDGKEYKAGSEADSSGGGALGATKRSFGRYWPYATGTALVFTGVGLYSFKKGFRPKWPRIRR